MSCNHSGASSRNGQSSNPGSTARARPQGSGHRTTLPPPFPHAPKSQAHPSDEPVGVGSGRVDEVPVPALVPLQVLSAGSIITPIYMPPTSPLITSPVSRACVLCCAVLHVQHDKPRPDQTRQPERQASVPSDAWMGGWVSMFERAMASQRSIQASCWSLHWLPRRAH